MPFGLSNAPSAFQRLMNKIFADILDVFVVVYLDDILIYSDNLTEHKQHVKEVLWHLRKHGLFTSPAKCSFHQTQVEFLGFVLGPDGLQMDNSKVQVIHDWPRPRQLKDVQAFLGFANFYRRFIKNYSQIVLPLTYLTQKDITWNWSADCKNAFESLKSAFTTAPVLAH